jgi:hypothetical protein
MPGWIEIFTRLVRCPLKFAVDREFLDLFGVVCEMEEQTVLNQITV